MARRAPARAVTMVRDSSSVASWTYRRRTFSSGSLIPCHFSGGVLSDFVRRVSVAGFTLISPRFVRTTVPVAPTMSPRSRASRRAPDSSDMASWAQNSWRSPVRSRITTNARPPCRRISTIRPATERTASVSSPGARPSNSLRTPAASASLAKLRANGGTPRSRRRSRVSRPAATTRSNREPSVSGGSVIGAGVPFEDQAQALQREPRLVVVHAVAMRGDDRRHAAGDHHGGGAPQLLLHPFDHAVDLGRGPEHQAGLEGLHGVLPDDRTGGHDLHPR